MARPDGRASARKSFVLLVAGMVIFFFCSLSSAVVPDKINYQGKLTTAGGGCLNDTVSMTFTIYSDSSGTSAEWTETQNNVVVKEGIFNVLLGSVSAIPGGDTVFDGSTKYLGVQVESDPEMRPLKPMVSVAYAYRAGAIDGGGGDCGWVDDGTVVRLEDSTDNVGIGTASPEARLVVKSSGYTDGMRVIGSEGNPLFRVRQNSDNAGAIYVYDSTGSKARITASEGAVSYFNAGNVGIGTTSPSSKLHVEAHQEHAGYFTSDSLSSGTSVIHAEFTGTGTEDAIAVCGWSLPADGRGYGGDFIGGGTGVRGIAASNGSLTYFGVQGYAMGGSGRNYGVHGWATGSGTNYAGYFDGYLYASSASAGIKAFKIDHPLDPENKYLYHSSVESPDMKNVYDGMIALDANGEATVELPDYFEALNRDFRYQLTCIGGFAPVYIAEKITDNSFKIAGGEAGMEVSWLVTGIRKDPVAEANRIQVEVDKPAQEQGKYLNPEAYGLGEEYGMHYEVHKRTEEKLQQSSK